MGLCHPNGSRTVICTQQQNVGLDHLDHLDQGGCKQYKFFFSIIKEQTLGLPGLIREQIYSKAKKKNY